MSLWLVQDFRLCVCARSSGALTVAYVCTLTKHNGRLHAIAYSGLVVRTHKDESELFRIWYVDYMKLIA
jgi:hypothetical protein